MPAKERASKAQDKTEGTPGGVEAGHGTMAAGRTDVNVPEQGERTVVDGPDAPEHTQAEDFEAQRAADEELISRYPRNHEEAVAQESARERQRQRAKHDEYHGRADAPEDQDDTFTG